jgi:ATP-binding cassette subfamily B protein
MKLFTRTNTKSAKATLKLHWQEMRHEKKQVVFFSVGIPFAHLLYTVILPLIFSFVVQSLVSHPHDISHPLSLLGIAVAVSIVALIVNYFAFRVLFDHEERTSSRLTKRVVETLMSHSYQFFSNHKVGSLSGDVTGFIRSNIAIQDQVFLQASGILVNFIFSLIIIAFLSPILLIPLGLLTVFVIIQAIRSLSKRAHYRDERKKRTTELNGNISDILGNQLLVRVFAREKQESAHVMQTRHYIEDISHKEIAILQREAMYRMGTLYLFQILTIAGSIWLFSLNMISIAALIFAVTYLGRVTSSLFAVAPIIRSLEQAFLDAAPMTEILSQAPEVQDVPNAKELVVKKGAINMKDVVFHYQDNGDAVFNTFSLDIQPGERVGVAGHSGGGKSTLTKLILRFTDIDSGQIMIDGQDISKVTQSSLRSNIAYVPQEPFLFHRSLRDNIAYARPDATDKEVREACRKAHALEFIDKLPHGLDTTVGERGVKLSGGQRQRIAIARAILKDAPILILDEATSALDSESEKLIQSSLKELMKGRTSIVIAHRLSTIQKLDRIIVLQDGAIKEGGTHAQLLDKNGVYANLWAHQSGGFIEE